MFWKSNEWETRNTNSISKNANKKFFVISTKGEITEGEHHTAVELLV